MNVGADASFSIQDPTTFIVDKSAPEHLRSLIDYRTKHGFAYLVNRMLTSDISESSSFGAELGLADTAGGTGGGTVAIALELERSQPRAVLGVNLEELTTARWYHGYSTKELRQDYEALVFRELYSQITGREFNENDRFVEVTPRPGGAASVRFVPPFASPQFTGIYVDDQLINNTRSFDLEDARKDVFFVTTSGNKLFSYNLKLNVVSPIDTGIPGNPAFKGTLLEQISTVEIDDRNSFATVLSWEGLSADQIKQRAERAQTLQLIDSVATTTESVLLAMTQSLSNGSGDLVELPRDFDPYKGVPTARVEALENAIATVKTRELNEIQQTVVEYAKEVLTALQSGQAVKIDRIVALQEEVNVLSNQLGFMIFTIALEQLKSDGLQEATESFLRAAVVSSDPKWKTFYYNLAGSTKYTQWQRRGRDCGRLADSGADSAQVRECERHATTLGNQVRAIVSDTSVPGVAIPASLDQGKFALDWSGPRLVGNDPPQPWATSVFVESAGNKFDIEDSKRAILITENGSFALRRPVNFSVSAFPYIGFDWNAAVLPKDGDVRIDAKDDQAIQLIIGFSDKEGRLRGLNYVWDTTAAVGTVHSRPVGDYGVDILLHYLVVESGDKFDGLNWQKQRRNFVEDVGLVFGPNVQPESYVMVIVQSNSQHTGTTTEGAISEIVFAREPIPVAEDLAFN